jgi:3D (Asp-Asp-Asp) domain-containing protein
MKRTRNTLGASVRSPSYKDGKAVDPHMIRAGTRVHLDFDRTGAVKRVVVVAAATSMLI